MSKVQKVPVSERALLARINRKLKHDDQAVKKCRSDSQWHHELGDYYVIGYPHGGVDAKNIDIESWGREMEVLAEHEELR